jgi:hypothetical protein
MIFRKLHFMNEKQKNESKFHSWFVDYLSVMSRTKRETSFIPTLTVNSVN